MKLAVYVIFAHLVSFISGQHEESQSIYQGCNLTIFDGQGFILSPNYPQNYEPNTYCEWKLTVENDRTIFMQFSMFELETSRNCAFDNLKLYNGPTTSHPLLGKFCGPFRPSNVLTTSNRMLLTFKSDDSTEKSGFLAQFISTVPQLAERNSCGGLLTGESGDFHSVNFPKSNYPNEMTCVWHIKATPGQEIVLQFSKFTLEVSVNCKYDSVTIYSGSSENDNTEFLGRYCLLSQLPDAIVSGDNEMFVTFATDSSGNDVGFAASYTTKKISVTDNPSTTSTTSTTEPTTDSTTTTQTISIISTTQSTTLPHTQTTLVSTPPTTVCPTTCPYLGLDETNVCSYAEVFYVKIAKVKPGRILVIVKTIKSSETLTTKSKKKRKIWMNIKCPECYPEFEKRAKYIMAGSSLSAAGLSPPDRVQSFNKKLYKTTKKSIKKCRRVRRHGKGRRRGNKKIKD